MRFVAHRGFAAVYPENTIPAFEAVLKHPECGKLLTGIETDIRLTADGRMILFHDDRAELECTKSQPIESLTYEEVAKAVEVRFGGVKPPVIDQFLACVGHKLELLIEMKDADYDKKLFMDILAKALERYKPAGNVVLHSFSPELMELAVERFGKRGIRFGVLVSSVEELKKFSPELLANVETIHPYWERFVRQEEAYAAYGKPFNIWTVNRPFELETLRKAKHASMIRSFITDDLRVMKGV